MTSKFSRGSSWALPLTAGDYFSDSSLSEFISIWYGGKSASAKSAPRASFGLTEGNMPSRTSRGQVMLRVGSFHRIERSPAG